MFKFILKNSLKGIFQRKSFATINILGLSVGIAVFFMLFIYVKFQYSYDKFLDNSENTYRVELDLYQNGKLVYKRATSNYNVGPLMKEEIPQVESFARAGYEKCLIFKENVKLNAQDLFWVDSTFLKVVGVKMLQGNKQTALSEPYSTVISDEMAKLYFGEENPMNKTIFVNGHIRFNVKGVFKALPQNSHFNFKLLLSLSTGNVRDPGWGSDNRSWWGSSWLYTYVTLHPNFDSKLVEKKVNKLLKERLPNNLKAEGYEHKYNLTNVEEIHLNSHLDNEFKINGSKQNTNIMLIIAILIISIAWINFINISSSEVVNKAKSAGLHKLNGASKSHIIVQYLFEVLILNIISLLFTFLFIHIGASFFGEICSFPFSKYLSENSRLYLYLVGITLFGTILSGIYPAFILSSFKPHLVLKGTLFSSKTNFAFKKFLVVFQMFATISLIVASITIYKQINFINSKEMGFNKENCLVLVAPSTLNMDTTKYSKYLKFKELIKQSPNVKSVTSATYKLGQECLTQNSFNQIDGNEIETVSCKVNEIDDEFFNTINVKIIAGDEFKFRQKLNSNNVILNESACKAFGFKFPKDIIGKHISNNDKSRVKVIGVMSDYHQEDLKQAVQPMVFYHRHPFLFGYYIAKISGTNYQETINFMKKQWEQSYAYAPFDFSFLDKQLDSLYKSEQQFGKLLIIFTVLAILIACLGLLGLIIITTKKKVKEIGVRKVNGATELQVVAMLNIQFVRWVALAFLISIPVSYYAMQKWLSDFAYKTELSWWIFALAGVITLLISILTVSWQSWKSATANPIKSLRYE
jgi:putative ABC transport system permease protein